MARKAQENPQLDMTPMIDVVFELIIFFVVTLTQSAQKDETIELEDGKFGTELTPDELPMNHLQIDIASVDKNGKTLPEPRISISDITMTPAQLRSEIRARKDKNHGTDMLPVFIRADWNTPHSAVRTVLDICASEDIWQISFMAIKKDETGGDTRPRWYKAFRK